MKTPSLALFAITAVSSLLALSVDAAAPQAEAGPGRGQQLTAPPRAGGMVRQRLQGLDTNNDSKISPEEFLAPRLAHLDGLIARLDKNNDGLISLDEIHAGAAAAEHPARPPHPNLPARPGQNRAAVIACLKTSNPDFDPPEVPDHEAIGARFDQADTNGDGKLNLAELSAAVTKRAQAQFKRLDLDQDGFLTAADRQAGQAERAALAKAMQACIKAAK